MQYEYSPQHHINWQLLSHLRNCQILSTIAHVGEEIQLAPTYVHLEYTPMYIIELGAALSGLTCVVLISEHIFYSIDISVLFAIIILYM